jgi:hypothetical protein
MLYAPLMGDAEQPRSEFRIVAQAANVRDRAGKSLLYDIERRRPVSKEFGRVSEQRQLITLKKLVPGGRIVSAGGLDKIGVGVGHNGYSL